ncbi:excalibur calcium-binding domain-containing protein [Planomonospora parontospora]|uniref:excalibur calcium-binding domain-containing protein n=1 Tax=Planomonospora parontospora TaxID=58119 RepID=UPI00166FFB16|nr:excalibur calcium-binding domain-containing protein [Planomonospora parontospora]GGL55176.1 hypothetical protein GCM10014719_65580 [Planomonospora parontospora subsp. antibiotica]GII19784.1 hypothetical protein Ppa05_65100 [Planomonospora parontospora subsp. antibiotica]
MATRTVSSPCTNVTLRVFLDQVSDISGSSDLAYEFTETWLLDLKTIKGIATGPLLKQTKQALVALEAYENEELIAEAAPHARAFFVAAAEMANVCDVDQQYKIKIPKQPKPEKSPARPAADPRFDTCAEANRAGYGPYRRSSDVEYGWYEDRDDDGLVCERW